MDRVAIIKEGLRGIGTSNGVYYTNEEILGRLKALQAALSHGIFEKTHAENFTEKEVIKHLEMLASIYGLQETERFIRLKANLERMGVTIARLISGFAGERNAKKALKLISMDQGVKILYNVSLEDDGCQAEYDAIVVTPYGVFTVEVKNWSTSALIDTNGRLIQSGQCGTVYDLAGRMDMKEALLRCCLGDMFPKQYVGMLLFPNEKIEIKDEYHRLPYCLGGGISKEIKCYAKSGDKLSDKQIEKIYSLIINAHKPQKSLCTVDCEQIIADYAYLMAEIEMLAKATKEEAIKASDVSTNEVAKNNNTSSFWPTLGKIASAVVLGIPIVYLCAKGIQKLICAPSAG